MPSQPISGSINLASSSQKVTIQTGLFQGYSFDLIISAGATSNGTVYIYCQNVDPDNTTATYPPKLQYAISSGTFLGGLTAQPIDSAYLTAAQYCVISWPTGNGTGTLTIVGSAKTT